MSLLPCGSHFALLHSLRRVGDRFLLDFTEMLDGNRHVVRVWPNQMAELHLALLGQNASLKRVTGGQVVITVDVKELSNGRIFNRVRLFERPTRLFQIQSSVPTELPIMTFEEVFAEQEQSKGTTP